MKIRQINNIILVLLTVLAVVIIVYFYNSDTEMIKWQGSNLFDVYIKASDIVTTDGQKKIMHSIFKLKSDFDYSSFSVFDKEIKPVFIVPLYTASAYSENGFYDFYNGLCDTCLTVGIASEDKLFFTSSSNAVQILRLLGYDSITDIDLDKNPSMLLKYDKVIVLHNEYVTKNMFEAITSHPNVVYLYPNSLYAEIQSNFTKETISLIRGHGYPTSEITNGFDWKYDNTQPDEYDKACTTWKFYDVSNGKMLNCYPERKIWQDENFLKALKEL